MRTTATSSRFGPALLAGLTFLVIAGCTDTVYRDRKPFNPPPDAAAGFLGYFKTTDQQTTCGNCHVDHQADWEKHGHYSAYNSLVASGHAQPTCFGCHTVSQLGNAVDTAAGWNKVQDAAYRDVQCESCHGPGETHVKTPDASPAPLARAEADTLGDPANPTPKGVGTCAECHNGTHHPYVDQWRLSRHGEANTHASTSTTCAPCHEGRAVLRAWGVNSNYAEKSDVVDTLSAMGITCAVCHDPHGNGQPGQLRFPIDDPSLDGNLCMKCHSRRFELTAANGTPHGPQGPVLLGTAGWWPSGADTTPQATTHGDPAANPKLCAGCHVGRFTVTDASGNFTLQSVGHLFRPIPCLDQTTGEPLPGADNSCAYNTTERNWTTCVSAGCHTSPATAQQALAASRAVLQTLVNQLWVDTDADRAVDSATDGGYLAQISPSEFTANDNFISTAEGARFNAQLFGEDLTNHPDKSFGAHNPFLAQRILAASINAMQTTYSLPAPPVPVQSLLSRISAQAAAAHGAKVSMGPR